jgi:hypothetical protein
MTRRFQRWQNDSWARSPLHSGACYRFAKMLRNRDGLGARDRDQRRSGSLRGQHPRDGAPRGVIRGRCEPSMWMTPNGSGHERTSFSWREPPGPRHRRISSPAASRYRPARSFGLFLAHLRPPRSPNPRGGPSQGRRQAENGRERVLHRGSRLGADVRPRTPEVLRNGERPSRLLLQLRGRNCLDDLPYR